jgi:hypothetical protein
MLEVKIGPQKQGWMNPHGRFLPLNEELGLLISLEAMFAADKALNHSIH